MPPSVVFSCRLFLCRIRSGHLASVLCNCYTGSRSLLVPVATFCFAICDIYAYNCANTTKPANRSFLFLLLPKERNERTHDNLVHRAPYSPLHTPHILRCAVSRLNTSCLVCAGLWCKLYNFPDLIQARDCTELAAVTAFETY